MKYGFTAQPYVSELVFGIIFFYAIGIWNISKDFQANQFFQENYQLQFLATELSFLEKKAKLVGSVACLKKLFRKMFPYLNL